MLPDPRRAEILDDAKTSLVAGETIAQIAGRYGISSRCLEQWLSALGEEYADLRARWIDDKLATAQERLEDAADACDPVRIAGARELWKSATWYAERRDARYRPQQQVTADTTITVILDTSPRSGRTIEHVDNSDAVQQLPNADDT